MEIVPETGVGAVADTWSLHPQLAQDCTEIGNLPLSRLLVSNDANYPWLLLVPRRTGVTEIIDLIEADRVQLMAEIAKVGQALKAVTACDKLNVAAIGNVVAQLHVHVVVRRRSDPAWPRPIWGAVSPLPYEPAALATFIASLKREIGIGLAQP